MKPFWDRLMEEFESSPTALIADVDCTAEGEPLCTKHGIEGFPTLKYGDPNNLQEYEGGREYEDLLAFAKENLGPVCGPNDLDLCDEEQKAKIAALEAEGYEKLEARLAKINEGILAEEDKFKKEVQKLQDRYEELMKDLQKATNDLKGDEFDLWNSVYTHLKPEEEYDESDGSEFGDEYPGDGYDENQEDENQEDGYSEDESDDPMAEGYDESILKEHDDL